MTRSILSLTPILSLAFLSACVIVDKSLGDIDDEGTDDVADESTGDGSEDGTTGGDATEDGTSTDEGTTTGAQTADRLDILVVLDNSGSMGAVQTNFVKSISSLIDPLDDAGVDWRIGVTTTDNGNPWCPAGQTTPEAGNLVYSACTDRLQDFLFSDSVDITEVGCSDLCGMTSGELTTTNGKPWLERTDGDLNIAGDDAVAALSCLLPQGVNGCGFESQLESTRLALVRATDEGEGNFGFVRDDAGLLIIIITDEVDCSVNDNGAGDTIFDTEGEKAFWSDPNAPFPTSAVCWNAGVDCSGDADDLDCQVANKNVQGQPSNEENAVLRPAAQYAADLQALAASKGLPVRVGLIAGVGEGGQPHYADVSATDPGFQESFGVGPGCEGPDPFNFDDPIQAVPPARMLEVVEGFEAGVHSVCDIGGYAVALEAMANTFID